MSLSQRIYQIWNKSQHSPPKIPLIFYENEYMAVVDDSGAFIRFVSPDGQIFLALNTYCQLIQPDSSPRSLLDNIYVCNKVTPILCSPTGSPKDNRDFFVLNNIIPLLM